MQNVSVKVIDEIREITANEVAKKQDAAKLKFPKIIEKIKWSASRGESQLELNENEINEFDKKLLQQEGFSVSLTDAPRSNKYEDILNQAQYKFKSSKVWIVRW